MIDFYLKSVTVILKTPTSWSWKVTPWSFENANHILKSRLDRKARKKLKIESRSSKRLQFQSSKIVTLILKVCLSFEKCDHENKKIVGIVGSGTLTFKKSSPILKIVILKKCAHIFESPSTFKKLCLDQKMNLDHEKATNVEKRILINKSPKKPHFRHSHPLT